MFKLATDPPAFPCTQPSNPPKILLLNVTGKIEEKKTMNVSQIIVVTLLEERKQKKSNYDKTTTIDIWELYLSDNLLLMTTSQNGCFLLCM